MNGGLLKEVLHALHPVQMASRNLLICQARFRHGHLVNLIDKRAWIG